MADGYSLEDLEREDRLREEIGVRVRGCLEPVIESLGKAETGGGLPERAAAVRSRLAACMDLVGGEFLEDERQFQQALDEWVERESAGGMVVVWQQVGHWPRWTKRERLDALRILREACGNARRHGRASEVRILVRGWDDGFSVTVQDNGSGFPAGAGGTGGAGLRNMKLRAERCGARFFSSNRENQGVVIGWSLGMEEEMPACSDEVPEGQAAAEKAREAGKILGMELHDDLCQRLVGALLDLQLLRGELPEEDGKGWLRLKEAEDLLRHGYERIRGWSHELIESNALTNEKS